MTTRPCLFKEYIDYLGIGCIVSYSSTLSDRYHYAESVGFTQALKDCYLTSDEVSGYYYAYSIDKMMGKEC